MMNNDVLFLLVGINWESEHLEFPDLVWQVITFFDWKGGECWATVADHHRTSCGDCLAETLPCILSVSVGLAMTGAQVCWNKVVVSPTNSVEKGCLLRGGGRNEIETQSGLPWAEGSVHDTRETDNAPPPTGGELKPWNKLLDFSSFFFVLGKNTYPSVVMPIKLKLIRERADGLFSFVVDHPADILKWKKRKWWVKLCPSFLHLSQSMFVIALGKMSRKKIDKRGNTTRVSNISWVFLFSGRWKTKKKSKMLREEFVPGPASQEKFY